ncbi:MAG: ATP-binding protein [Dehalococcoidia bacterium]|nr:ATP-binding protein [Dehalococcoidia bacterium]
MINKSIDDISEQDLQTLIAQKEVEGKTIEYKQELPRNTDADKKEFLADISSFSNSSGGDLIYGMVEDKGMPKALDGLDIGEFDQVKQRLENLVRDGIEPRIPPLNIQPVPLSNTRTALVIRVPKSWSSPHRVRYQGHDKFYSRNSAGKYQLDVAELRIAFNLSETTAERIRKFRQDRISNIVANETPVSLPDTAKIVLHLIPITAFSPAQSYEINKIASPPEKMTPLRSHGWNHRYNIDGFLTYSLHGNNQVYSYVQLFRNGIIEAVEASMLRPREHGLYIPSVLYEQELISSLSNYLSLLETLIVEPPIFVFLTLLGVKGYRMGTDRIDELDELNAIDRDIILSPEILIENYQVIAEDVLMPCFDSIWNACGFSSSWNYKDGKWVGK